MRYIEPHAHMVSRTTSDYEALAYAGCKAVNEPAFWAGFDRSSGDGFYDYFRQITEYEPKRAAKFCIEHYCWLCINPKEAEDVGLAREVISIIPNFRLPTFWSRRSSRIRFVLSCQKCVVDVDCFECGNRTRILTR